ncbi:upstream stimulatory factor 2-like isoform X2 [Gigantopelta aegis]|uniref:upstream stimulatory factor 2-like isoform X2 n=1 Tax=Gigantopelta aegis TaxID=1735272 RepID=UPI001B888F2B|nr:upstream stimulatory factor 2-like isoform X2 [Gigantopelta aegis]
MDMLDQALDSSHKNGSPVNDESDHLGVHQGCPDESPEEQAVAIASVAPNQTTLTLDPSQVQYQLGQGPVTYRVVQVSQDGQEATAQVVTSSPFVAGQQAIVQSPFSNGGSPTPDQNEARFTYFPQVAAAGDNVATTDAVNVVSALGSVSTTGGQFYVMMSPQDVLQGQRNIAPRTSFSPKIEGRSTRDDRRRATHNEVERRRRDKINTWIVQLSKLVPDITLESTKSGQIPASSKGGILAKACDYITELRNANARMGESLKDTERISVDAELLRQQCEELKQENNILRTQLQQHGIVPQDLAPS